MAHSGFSSMILAKTFSDSSYSKEWSNAMARLKSCFALSLPVISNSALPNWLPAGLQDIIFPLFKFSSLISSFEGTELFPLQHKSRDAGNRKNKRIAGGIMYFIITKFCSVYCSSSNKSATGPVKKIIFAPNFVPDIF